MVRYKTSPKDADANATLVRSVFAELKESAPGGIRYTSYCLEDGVSFIHIATLDTPNHNPLTTLASFKAFQKDIKSRCVELPVVTELTAVGSYGAVA